MPKSNTHLADEFLGRVIHSLGKHDLARIEQCLKRLSEDQIWWRPNDASNSTGNLVLHLSGNVRQWIVSGLGGAPDCRQRDREFGERGPIPRRRLLMTLRKSVREACDVLSRLSARDLEQVCSIQGFHVTGFTAVFHVAEHFASHTGQIIFITKLQLGQGLGFTRLPGTTRRTSGRKNLPAI